MVKVYYDGDFIGEVVANHSMTKEEYLFFADCDFDTKSDEYDPELITIVF